MVAKTPTKRLTKRAPSRTPAVIAKQAEAVKMKVAGATYEDIAKILGYADHTGARWAVHAGLAARLDDAGVEELRQIELERLERLHLSRWKKATDGDNEAYVLVLRTMERRAKLLGLDAPVKHLHGGDPDNPLAIDLEVNVSANLKGLSDDELIALRSMSGKLAAGPAAGG